MFCPKWTATVIFESLEWSEVNRISDFGELAIFPTEDDDCVLPPHPRIIRVRGGLTKTLLRKIY